MKEILLSNCEKNFVNKSVEQGIVCNHILLHKIMYNK